MSVCLAIVYHANQYVLGSIYVIVNGDLKVWITVESPLDVSKVFRDEDTSRRTYQTLLALWHGGFRPPSPFTVSRPVEYVPLERKILVEKAPGEQLSTLVFRTNDLAIIDRWLNVIERCFVDKDIDVKYAA